MPVGVAHLHDEARVLPCCRLSLARNRPQWPSFMAAWKIYLTDPVDALLQLNLASVQVQEALAALLVWVSRSGVASIHVDDNAEDRARLLQDHLVIATKVLCGATAPAGRILTVTVTCGWHFSIYAAGTCCRPTNAKREQSGAAE